MMTCMTHPTKLQSTGNSYSLGRSFQLPLYEVIIQNDYHYYVRLIGLIRLVCELDAQYMKVFNCVVFFAVFNLVSCIHK